LKCPEPTVISLFNIMKVNIYSRETHLDLLSACINVIANFCVEPLLNGERAGALAKTRDLELDKIVYPPLKTFHRKSSLFIQSDRYRRHWSKIRVTANRRGETALQASSRGGGRRARRGDATYPKV
jgi:hypothetical protein